MIDFERQRHAMVESQLRPNEVTDRRVLSAMRALPRERFVPPALRGLAYMDDAIEVFPSIDGAPARFLLAPMVLARLVQLAIGRAQGQRSSMSAAPPAIRRRCLRVSAGRDRARARARAGRRRARRPCARSGSPMWRLSTALWRGGHEAGAPYDVILLNGSVPEVPEILALPAQGGRQARRRAIARRQGRKPGQGISLRQGEAERRAACRISTLAPGRCPALRPSPASPSSVRVFRALLS